MVLVNYATKEIVAKIVYYGPGLCGKTTNLQQVYAKLNPKKRGKMISLATEADRTLFFDFLPVELGVVQGFRVRFQLYTVPGQVFYGATRKLVLKGADAVVFVADSQADVMAKNIESLEDMKQNLLENDIDPYTVPLIFQYNKRDLGNIVDIWLLEKKLNYRQAPNFTAVATEGTGVMETFKEITNLLIRDLKKRHTLMDTDTLHELPPDIFTAPPKPKAEEVPIESVLEMGSRVEGAGEEVVAGELLDQVEVISLADTVQAEAFFEDVRKGAPAEEARQKAEQIKQGWPEEAPQMADEMKQFLEEAETLAEAVPPLPEIAPPQEEPAPEPPKPSAPAQEKPRWEKELEAMSGGGFSGIRIEEEPPGEIHKSVPEMFLGLDMTSPEMMEPGGVVAEEAPAEVSRPAAPAGPSRAYAMPEPEPAPAYAAPAQEMDISPVISAIERLGGDILSLREDMREMAGEGKPDERFKKLEERVEGMEQRLKEAIDGHDHLLLALLEAVRELKKANADSNDRVEDALKYIAGKLGEESKTPRKKWF